MTQAAVPLALVLIGTGLLLILREPTRRRTAEIGATLIVLGGIILITVLAGA